MKVLDHGHRELLMTTSRPHSVPTSTFMPLWRHYFPTPTHHLTTSATQYVSQISVPACRLFSLRRLIWMRFKVLWKPFSLATGIPSHETFTMVSTLALLVCATRIGKYRPFTIIYHGLFVELTFIYKVGNEPSRKGRPRRKATSLPPGAGHAMVLCTAQIRHHVSQRKHHGQYPLQP